MVAGVQYIHSLGIAHLDIKPENMLIDGNDTLKISDFGLAMWMPINAIPGARSSSWRRSSRTARPSG